MKKEGNLKFKIMNKIDCAVQSLIFRILCPIINQAYYLKGSLKTEAAETDTSSYTGSIHH